MKDLKDITQEEVETICELCGEPYLSYMAGCWKNTGINLAIQINTTSTAYRNNDDSYITIDYDGAVNLSRNNGDWGGMRNEKICSLMITDYLRSVGYGFNYEIPKQLERKFKLNELNKISKI